MATGFGRMRAALACALASVLVAGAFDAAGAQTVLSADAVLPKGSDLGGLRQREPRQILSMEAQGVEQSYLVALGNMAFSTPLIKGASAQGAGIACSSCHSSGEINRRFFLAGSSAYPGSADVTSGLFNPRFDDGLDNPLDIPSLRGIALTAPYGHDGRFASLREFTRNVIVNEFAGPEPSPVILDALVVYQRQFEFLPNDKLDRRGRLTDAAGDAALRGEALFTKRFEQMDGRSCASCHLRSAQFTDGQQHDVGTARAFETPTLLNANFTAPYFADGRAQSYDAVVAHFDDFYGLGLTAAERADLVAYLEAVGDGERPFVDKDFAFDLAEVMVFASTLERTITDRNYPILDLTVATINSELRDIREKWYRPDSRETRAVIADWVLQMRRVERRADRGDWNGAREALGRWRALVERTRPRVSSAEGESLYNAGRMRDYLSERRGNAD